MVNPVLRHFLSAFRFSDLSDFMDSDIQGASGWTVTLRVFRGACRSNSSERTELYLSVSSSTLSLSSSWRPDAIMSALNASMSMDLSFRKVISFFGSEGFVASIWTVTEKWSERRSSWTFNESSDSEDLVITMSRVWPPLCVGPVTCWTRLNLSNKVWNFWASVFVDWSRWKFRSPHMMSFPCDIMADSRKEVNSSMNNVVVSMFLDDGGGR